MFPGRILRLLKLSGSPTNLLWPRQGNGGHLGRDVDMPGVNVLGGLYFYQGTFKQTGTFSSQAHGGFDIIPDANSRPCMSRAGSERLSESPPGRRNQFVGKVSPELVSCRKLPLTAALAGPELPCRHHQESRIEGRGVSHLPSL